MQLRRQATPTAPLPVFLWIEPQNPPGVPIPLKSVDALKALMQNRLDYEGCNDAVNRLIARLGLNASNSRRPENQPVFASVMDVFDKIAGEGGIRVNVPVGEYPPGKRVPGGSGYSWRDSIKVTNIDVRWSMKTWVYLKSAYQDSPQLSFDRIPYDYGITGIHEMLHQISRYGYDEDELDQAARDLGGSGVDNYLRKHCNPNRFR